MLNASCAKEMASAQGNQSRVKAAKKCEDETVFKNDTVEFLQKAEKEKAVAEVEKSLTQCLGISAKCAKEVSPRVVLKVKMSGIAGLQQKCKDVVTKLKETNQTEESKKCEAKSGKTMLNEVLQQNLEGAMDTAEHALHSCKDVAAPCDFQLAPMLVMGLMQKIVI